MDPLGDRSNDLEPLRRGLFPWGEMRNKGTEHAIPQPVNEALELTWNTHVVDWHRVDNGIGLHPPFSQVLKIVLVDALTLVFRTIGTGNTGMKGVPFDGISLNSHESGVNHRVRLFFSKI